MGNMIVLTRSQMRKPKENAFNADVTVLSAKGVWREFAPEWKWVRAVKDGYMDEEEYTALYLNKLRNCNIKNVLCFIEKLRNEAISYGNHDMNLNFQCYCKDGAFCHTYLLIGWLCSEYDSIFMCF